MYPHTSIISCCSFVIPGRRRKTARGPPPCDSGGAAVWWWWWCGFYQRVMKAVGQLFFLGVFCCGVCGGGVGIIGLCMGMAKWMGDGGVSMDFDLTD